MPILPGVLSSIQKLPSASKKSSTARFENLSVRSSGTECNAVVTPSLSLSKLNSGPSDGIKLVEPLSVTKPITSIPSKPRIVITADHYKKSHYTKGMPNNIFKLLSSTEIVCTRNEDKLSNNNPNSIDPVTVAQSDILACLPSTSSTNDLIVYPTVSNNANLTDGKSSDAPVGPP